MRKYLLKMNQLGLTKATISKALQKSVTEFEEAETEYQELKTQLGQMNPEDAEYEELKTEVSDYESVLEESDVELEEKIQKFNSNKAEYERKVKQMQAANDAKKAKSAAAAAATAQTAAPVANSGTLVGGKASVTTNPNGTTATVVPAAQGGNPPVVIIDPNAPPAPKKDSGGWLLWGALGLLGLLVGVNVMKNRE